MGQYLQNDSRIGASPGTNVNIIRWLMSKCNEFGTLLKYMSYQPKETSLYMFYCIFKFVYLIGLCIQAQFISKFRLYAYDAAHWSLRWSKLFTVLPIDFNVLGMFAKFIHAHFILTKKV